MFRTKFERQLLRVLKRKRRSVLRDTDYACWEVGYYYDLSDEVKWWGACERYTSLVHELSMVQEQIVSVKKGDTSWVTI